jgi:hypothetical protein
MRLTKQQFINCFTPTEMADILTAAKTVVAVEAWLFRFDNLTPSEDGTAIDTAEESVIQGVQSFEDAGLLATGRAAQILGVTEVNDEQIATVTLATDQPCAHDAQWTVIDGGTYAVTDLVAVQNAAGLSCAFQAQFIATGEFA